MKTYISSMIITLLLLVISGCGDSIKSIADAEKKGFTKDQQLFFAMIGAVDGYSGTWKDENVALYAYESAEKINKAFFDASLSDDKKICIKQNLVMIAPESDNKACAALENL